jgi:hypothetical protein
MTNSWERQANESANSFKRFCCYRDMGIDRSLRKLASDLQLNVSTLAELSKNHFWQSRVNDFDGFIERASQHNQIAQIRVMKRRQIALALRAQKAAAKGLKKLIREIENNDDFRLKPEGLSKLIDTGCRIERLNRDEPEQNLEIKQQQDLNRLDEDELEIMKRLLKKAGGNG